MKWFWLPIFLSILSVQLVGEDIKWQFDESDFSIEIDLSGSSLNEGDLLSVHAKLIYPSDYQVNELDLMDRMLWYVNPFKPKWLISKKEIVTSEEDGKRSLTMDLKLAPMLNGKVDFSFFNVKYSHKEPSKNRELFTPIFSIDVIPDEPLSDQEIHQKIVDDLALIPLEPRFAVDLDLANREYLFSEDSLNKVRINNQNVFKKRSFPWGYVLLSLFGMMGWLGWNRLKSNREEGIKLRLMETSQEKALRELDYLQEKGLPEKGLFKEFYSELTLIVRKYLENRFDLSISSQTTDEFMNDKWIQGQFPEEIQKAFKVFLNASDQVKFAQKPVSSGECAQAYEMAKRFILLNEKKVMDSLKGNS